MHNGLTFSRRCRTPGAVPLPPEAQDSSAMWASQLPWHLTPPISPPVTQRYTYSQSLSHSYFGGRFAHI